VLALIIERAQKFTHAAGASICLLDADRLVCKASSGEAMEKSSTIELAASLSATCLTTGQLLQCTDTSHDSRVPAEACRAQGVRSLIAVPVFQDAKIAGMLELRFSQANSFEEHGVRTCQLMAGLVTEALNRAAEQEWKQVLSTERASMMEVLEKLRPQLERLAVSTNAEPAAEIAAPTAAPEPLPRTLELTAEENEKTACRGCGQELSEEEAYCGICGTPHPLNKSVGGDIQSKWASMWHMRQAAEKKDAEQVAKHEPLPPELEKIAIRFEEENSALTGSQAQPLSIIPAETAVPVVAEPWASASSARKWLESLKSKPSLPGWLARIWRQHRANFYLVISAVLLGLVLAGWGSGADTVNASANAKWAKRHPQPQLTAFEKVLVGLNLAVPPTAPDYRGNPDARVWVDTHTALYYCDGSDLFGKTPGGKFSTQREAQIDQFEPDARKVCD
jgi:putative methionine-R-sulfoxide reductase with GAF domain